MNSVANSAQVAALVLAGGRSRRFGEDKRRFVLDKVSGMTLLEQTVSSTQACCSEVVVALNDPQAWPQLTIATVADRWSNVGPLAGIAAGFAALSSPWVLVLAADLPLLDIAVLNQLLAQPRAAQAVVPRHASGQLEPLVALYQRATLPLLEQFVAGGGRSLHAWLDLLDVQFWDTAGVSADVWLNLNAPADAALLRSKFDIL